MAHLTLKRFKDVASYTENKTNGSLKDGDLFIIDETRQLGTNRKGDYILTPSNTLHDYILPDGELVITSHNSISKAIAKLEYCAKVAKNLAQTAIDTALALEELENRVDNLPKHVCISESAYGKLEAINQNTVYYIYAND